MEEILNKRINNWIKEFSDGKLEWDSYHINELHEREIPKSKWIECAFKAYSLCEKAIHQSNTEISAALCFELNITTSHCPVPSSLSKQCFNKTDTPPEVYLFMNKEERSWHLDDALYLQDLSASYNMQVYLREDRDDVYWRWLFFMENDN